MISYRYKENRVTIMPYFLYEVNIYRLEKNMASILNSKFYKSDELINIKNDEIILERTKDYTIVKNIDIIGVPEDFVKKNSLEVYELRKPIKKVKEKSKKVTFTLKKKKRK